MKVYSCDVANGYALISKVQTGAVGITSISSCSCRVRGGDNRSIVERVMSIIVTINGRDFIDVGPLLGDTEKYASCCTFSK